MSFCKKCLWRFIKGVFIGILCIGLIQVWFLLSTKNQIVEPSQLNVDSTIWLVLGASVYRNWTPSPVLKDRLDTAIQLYELWYIDRIVVSGDNASVEYNEVHGMSNYLQQQWVPAAVIFQDYAWFDTYDSMYRAREIFQIQQMVIITQQFHLPRALAIANSLWLHVQWVAADNHLYIWIEKMQFREIGARIKAFGEILIGSSAKFGGEVIDIKGESNTLER